MEKRALVMISNGDSLILPTYSRFGRGVSLKNASKESSCRRYIQNISRYGQNEREVKW
jgi:hypothetical protein